MACSGPHRRGSDDDVVVAVLDECARTVSDVGTSREPACSFNSNFRPIDTLELAPCRPVFSSGRLTTLVRLDRIVRQQHPRIRKHLGESTMCAKGQCTKSLRSSPLLRAPDLASLKRYEFVNSHVTIQRQLLSQSNQRC